MIRFSQSRVRRLYDFFQRNWLLTALVTTGPGLAFILFQIVGEPLRLKAATGALTTFGAILFWITVVIAFGTALLKSKADAINHIMKENAQYVLDRLIECLDSIKYKKVRRFSEYIFQHPSGTGLSPFDEITQPRLQIESILEQIRDALADIFGIPAKDIGISIIYRTNYHADWQWLHTMNIERDIRLEELINNPHSSARQIIDGRAREVFFPRKADGAKRDQFVPGQLDNEHGLEGSVICRDLSLSPDHCPMQAVLSLTTYGYPVCDTKDTQAQKKITEILLPSFELRLRNELALLYIKEVLVGEKGENGSG